MALNVMKSPLNVDIESTNYKKDPGPSRDRVTLSFTVSLLPPL